jgi:hypothetical protein
MKKKIKISIAAIFAVVTLFAVAQSRPKGNFSDKLVIENAEALSAVTDSVCSGPKVETINGNIICECTNRCFCKDEHGCN